MYVLCAALGIVCFYDYAGGRIPNRYVALLMLLGLIRSFHRLGIVGAGGYLLTGFGVCILLYPLYRIGGLGGGDVKLLSVCAGYFDISQVFEFLFLSLLISAVFSIIPILKERNVRERIEYFCEYCLAVAGSGKWRLYLSGEGEKRFGGVCMSGPILCSVLLSLGGMY